MLKKNVSCLCQGPFESLLSMRPHRCRGGKKKKLSKEQNREIVSRTIPNEHTVWDDVQTLIGGKKKVFADYLGNTVNTPEGS